MDHGGIAGTAKGSAVLRDRLAVVGNLMHGLYRATLREYA